MTEYKRKLSLAVIYGNVENVMERFLKSFAPLVDEIILVRAIGNQKPDASRYIAEQFLRDGDTLHTFAEYKNKGEHYVKLKNPIGYCHEFVDWDSSKWPHVDDFAAARQMAFNLAKNEWVMWADTDDILDPKFIPVIRRALDGLTEDTMGIQMPYRIPEEGLVHIRERIVKKAMFKWHSPIHECLLPLDMNGVMGSLNSVEIVHMPINRGRPSDERNMRILETLPESDKSLSHKFHTFQTLRAVKRDADAVKYGMTILGDPANEFGAAEKYEMLLGMGQMAGAGPQREQLYLQAIAADPSRREAYGELMLCELQKRDAGRMKAWGVAMLAHSKPIEWPWNARRPYWGWQAIQLQSMALRLSGDHAGAYALQLNHFKANGAKISLLHATRGRCAQASAALRNWLAKAANGDAIEHIFAIDADDNESMEFLTVFNHVVVNGNGPVAAWNAAAEVSSGEVLIQLSDDWEPPMHWDKLILERIGDTSKPSVLQISDGHRKDDLMCMAICTRQRWLDQGYLFHPDFFSMYSDNWFSECAHRDGVVIDARDVVFEHLHPVFGKAEVDDVYARSNARANYDQGAIHCRRLQSGAITSWDVDGWCDFRDLYTAIANKLQDGDTFVEVGAWKGQSIIHLCQRLQDQEKKVKLWAVDTFSGDADTGTANVYPEFDANIEAAGCGDIMPMALPSVEAATGFKDGCLAGVFIDAAHDFDSVLADINAWLPKVKKGGIFAGHDADSEGVQRALKAAGVEWVAVGRCWVKSNAERIHGGAGQSNQPETPTPLDGASC